MTASMGSRPRSTETGSFPTAPGLIGDLGNPAPSSPDPLGLIHPIDEAKDVSSLLTCITLLAYLVIFGSLEKSIPALMEGSAFPTSIRSLGHVAGSPKSRLACRFRHALNHSEPVLFTARTSFLVEEADLE
jgi:hypothetical protein